MKRIILLLLIVSIFLAGCQADQYSLEKQYWQAQKLAEKIFNNPHASPPQELNRVVGILNNFTRKHPQSNLAVDAEFSIARLYIATEEYNKARAQLNSLLDKYNKSSQICSEVLFLIGNSYEIEDKWNLALEQYKKIVQEYAGTIRGLSIPIYIAQHYKIKYQPDKMLSSYEEAISHYKALADKYPNSPLSYNAHSLAAQCYVAMKDWQNAVNTFKSIIEKYKAQVNMDEVLMSMAVIYRNELKNNAKAKEALEQLIKDYPKSRFIKTAKGLLLIQADKK